MNSTASLSILPGWVLRLHSLAALLMVAALLSLGADMRAATIGVNFAPPASGQALPPAVSAGVVPQTNWQNITSTTTSTSISSTTLNDNTGAATTAALSVSAPSSFIGLGWYNNSAAVGDEWLMGTNLAASGTMSFTVTSIPYAAYDLIVYNLPLFSSVLYTYTAGSTSYFGTSPSAATTSPGYVDGNGGTAFNFLEATSTSGGSPTANSTYTRFEGLTGSSLTFSITGGNGISYINGFQIVETVPEPSRAVLFMAGILAVAGRRTRRRP